MLDPMTDALTLYSRLENGYFGTRLTGTAIRRIQSQSLSPTGPKLEDRATILYIPARGGRRGAQEFSAETDKTGHFTLLPGDYVVLGESEQGLIPGELRQKIPGALRIRTVTDHVRGSSLDHWEVEAL